MFDFLKKKTEINTTQIVDEIEAAVYEHVKPYGFKKYGRTLHRFISEDISQVIHFQSGKTDRRSNLTNFKARDIITKKALFTNQGRQGVTIQR